MKNFVELSWKFKLATWNIQESGDRKTHAGHMLIGHCVLKFLPKIGKNLFTKKSPCMILTAKMLQI